MFVSSEASCAEPTQADSALSYFYRTGRIACSVSIPDI